MSHGNHDHPSLMLAASELGQASICPCGVVTLSLQCLSLRLEPDAFRALHGLLTEACRRLDGGVPVARCGAPAPGSRPAPGDIEGDTEPGPAQPAACGLH